MCFAALGRPTQRCQHPGLELRVELAVHEGFLKLAPFVDAALVGIRDLSCSGYFLLCGDFLQIARPDQVVYLTFLYLSDLLRHRAGLGVPDFRGVFGDRAVAREASGAGDVQDRLLRPVVGVGVKLQQTPVGIEIRGQVR
jgi:hypothetical protein